MNLLPVNFICLRLEGSTFREKTCGCAQWIIMSTMHLMASPHGSFFCKRWNKLLVIEIVDTRKSNKTCLHKGYNRLPAYIFWHTYSLDFLLSPHVINYSQICEYHETHILAIFLHLCYRAHEWSKILSRHDIAASCIGL